MSTELLPIWGATGTKIQPDNTKLSVGWTLGEKPPYEYMNWWQGVVTDRVNDILQNGPAPWAAGTTYQIGALVSRAGVIYRSLAINANSQPPSANWLAITQNASALTSGTVPAARLPAIQNPTAFQGVAPQITAENTAGAINAVSEYKTTAGSVYAGQGSAGVFAVGPAAALATGGNTRFTVNTATGAIGWSGEASGNGGGITNLNAGALAAGTVPNARMNGDYSFANLTLSGNLNLAGNVSGANRFLGTAGGSGVDPTFGFVGVAGVGMHKLSDPASPLTLNYSGGPRLAVSSDAVTVTGGAVFTGSGAGLTNVPAGSLTGTVANDRISGDYSFANLSLSGTVSAALAQISRYEAASGSAAAPSYGFLGAPGMGVYRNGGTIYLASGGTPGLGVNDTQVVVVGGRAFAGNGSGLTTINGDAISSGTVADARLPGTMAQKTFTGAPALVAHRNNNSVNALIEYRTTATSVYAGQSSANRFAIGPDGNLTSNSVFRVDTPTGNVAWDGTATGNGGGISGLSASALSSGTVPNARMNGDYSFANLTLSGNLNAAGAVLNAVLVGEGSATSPSLRIGSGMGFYRAGGILGGVVDGVRRLMITADAITAAGGAVFAGNGSELTNLEASALATGEVNAARLPTTTAARTWVGARMGELAYNAIGSTAMLGEDFGGRAFPAGSTFSGTWLKFGGLTRNSDGDADVNLGGPSAPGVWLACGNTGSSTRTLTTFRRIA